MYGRDTGKDRLLILVYVDDRLIVGHCGKALQEVSERINLQVDIRVEKRVETFLGMIIERNRVTKTLKLSNPNLITDMAFRFNLSNAASTAIPMTTNQCLDHVSDECEVSEEWNQACVPYKELVGTLLHLSNTVRPDIAFSTSHLSRFMVAFQRKHWLAAKQVLRYLLGTSQSGNMYQANSGKTFRCDGYCDSDFTGFRIDRKSTSVYMFVVAGGAVSWRSKKQTVVAQSSMESEYISCSFAVREVLWMLQLLKDLCRVHQKSMILY